MDRKTIEFGLLKLKTLKIEFLTNKIQLKVVRVLIQMLCFRVQIIQVSKLSK